MRGSQRHALNCDEFNLYLLKVASTVISVDGISLIFEARGHAFFE
jgi:hypothetical protein